MKRRPLIAILGPTASGKSAFAVQLAQAMDGEIVCVDSTTVYLGLDIGSSKPSSADRAKVPHHLIDVLKPNEPFSAFHFVKLAGDTIQEILSRGKQPILVGGTYFYLRALQHGMYDLPPIPAEVIDTIEAEYFSDEEGGSSLKLHAEVNRLDAETAKSLHPNDRYRLVRALAILRSTGNKPSELKPVAPAASNENHVWMKYSMALSRHRLNQAIVQRTDKMLSAGLIEEVKTLLEKYPGARSLESIGYREAVAFLQKRLTEKQLRNEIIEKTRQLAKRQVTWIRSDAEIRFVDERDQERVMLEWNNLRFALGEVAA